MPVYTLSLIKIPRYRGVISMSSYYNRKATRQNCEGYMKLCSLLRISATFLFSSYCHREDNNVRWHLGSYEVNTNNTWSYKMPSRCSYETQNVDTTWTRRGPFGTSFKSFFACQRFPENSRSWCRCSRNTTGVYLMAYDALVNGPMFSWCFNDHFWTSGHFLWNPPRLLFRIWYSFM